MKNSSIDKQLLLKRIEAGSEITLKQFNYMLQLKDPKIDLLIAKNLFAPFQVLKKLALSADLNIRFQLSQRNDLTLNILKILVHDPSIKVRIEIAKKNLEFVNDILYKDLQEEVQMLVSKNYALSTKVIKYFLANKNSILRMNILKTFSLKNYNEMEEQYQKDFKNYAKWFTKLELEKLSNSKDERIKIMAIGNYNFTSPNLLLKLSRDKSLKIREAVIDQLIKISESYNFQEITRTSKLDLTKKFLKIYLPIILEFSRDESDAIRYKILGIYQIDMTLFKEIYSKLSLSTEDRIELASDWNQKSEVLDYLSQENDVSIKLAVANNFNTSSKTLDELTDEGNFEIDLAIANHYNISSKTATKLSASTFWEIVCAIAKNSKTPKSVLAFLAKHPDEEVRINVAQNNNTPLNTLKILANDNSKSVNYFPKIRISNNF